VVFVEFFIGYSPPSSHLGPYTCPRGFTPAIACLAGLPLPRQFVIAPAHIALKAYVVNTCVKCFRCSASVSYGYCKEVDLDFAYFAMAIHVYYKCLFKMFHLLHMCVASVLSECCSGYTHMLQWTYTYVACVRSKCFIYSDVCYGKWFHVVKCFMSRRMRSLYAHILQWLYTYVASIYS
jgi:hypothetical protein